MNNDWDKDGFDQADDGGFKDADADPTTLDMIAGSTDLDEFAAPKRKSGSKGFMVLIMALVVGGGSLYAMHMAGSGEPVGIIGGDAEKKVEAALAKLVGNSGQSDVQAATSHALDVLFRDTDDIIAMFSHDPVNNQVELEELQKNPFKLLVATPRRSESGETVTTVDTAERERQARLATLEAEYKTYRVQSVLTGNPSLAVINNKVVRTGETIGSFSVGAIGSQGVRLHAEGQTYTLELAQPATDGNRR